MNASPTSTLVSVACDAKIIQAHTDAFERNLVAQVTVLTRSLKNVKTLTNVFSISMIVQRYVFRIDFIY